MRTDAPALQLWIEGLVWVGFLVAWLVAVRWDRQAENGTTQVERLARRDPKYRQHGIGKQMGKQLDVLRRLGERERIRRRG